MPDELIDILNKDGNPTGEVKMKSEAHQKGLYHASVHIWFYTKAGKVLLQKRSRDKGTYPDLWDVSVAGHIGAGERVKNSALREIQEEIGLSVSAENLKFLKVYLAEKKPRADLFDNEFHHIFLSELKVPLKELSLQKEEVYDVKLISIKELRQQLDDIELSKAFVPHGTVYFNFIIEAIQTKLKK
ncbi:NUDIX domain-containing protein [Aquimarina sp. SS2-1]|uniref:NUDIX hydrolase n=1 Tax=Aquimarina besae TaxID=3342247 RepID=UPI00366C1739